MAIDLNGVVDWLKGWFYDKSEINTYLNAKANKNLTNANMNVVTDASGNISTEAKPVIPDISGKEDKSNKVSSWSGTTNNTHYPGEKLVKDSLDGKVDKVTGKGLSTNDYTTDEKNKLAGIEAQANKYVHPTGIGTAQTSEVFKKIKYDAQGHITGTANVGASDLPSHTHTKSNISDFAHTHDTDEIDCTVSFDESYDGETLTDFLMELLVRMDSFSNLDAVKIVQALPPASIETTDSLYIVSETDNNNETHINVYYTDISGTYPNQTYSWHKLDEDILDELSISWNDITDKPNLEDFVLSDNETLSGQHCQLFFNKTSDDIDFKHGLYVANDAFRIQNLTARMYRSDLTGDDGTHYVPIASTLDLPTDVSDLTDTNNTPFTPKSHSHGYLENDGRLTYQGNSAHVVQRNGVAITNNNGELVGIDGLPLSRTKDANADNYTNIGSLSIYSSQEAINSAINTALGGKADASDVITSIALVPKSTNANGKIIFYTGDEPT